MRFSDQGGLLGSLSYFHFIIKSRQRGTRAEIADRLGVGKNKLTDMLNLLRSHGAEVAHNRHKGCYEYHNNFEFFIGVARDRDVA